MHWLNLWRQTLTSRAARRTTGAAPAPPRPRRRPQRRRLAVELLEQRALPSAGISGHIVANDDTATLGPDGSVTIPVLANDQFPDGGTIGGPFVDDHIPSDRNSYPAIHQFHPPGGLPPLQEPAHGGVDVSGRDNWTKLVYDANFLVPFPGDRFSYWVDYNSNTFADVAEATVTINPGPLPTASDFTVTATGGAPLQIDFESHTANYSDRYQLPQLSKPSSGTAQVFGGIHDGDPATITYTPKANFAGEDRFTYTVSNPSGTATGTITVEVEPGVRIADVSPDVASNFGPASTRTVTITGKGFQQGATVFFQRSDPAVAGDNIKVKSVDVQSATTIQVGVSTVDVHPEGYFDLTVTNPDGTKITLVQGFYVSSLVIQPLEINQGVPLGPASPLPAVARHNTVVRVKVESNGGNLTKLNPLDVRLRVLRDGKQVDLRKPDPNGYQVQLLDVPADATSQSRALDSFNFYFTPDQLPPGKYEFRAEVDPVHPTKGVFASATDLKYDLAHDLVVARSLVFRESNPLTIGVLVDGDNPADVQQTMKSFDLLRAMYPISADKFAAVYNDSRGSFRYQESDFTGHLTLSSLAAFYHADHAVYAGGQYIPVQGMVFFTRTNSFQEPDGGQASGLTDAGLSGSSISDEVWKVAAPVSIVRLFDEPNRTGETVCHEVGHWYDLGDTYPGGDTKNPAVNPITDPNSDKGNPVEPGNFNTVRRKVSVQQGLFRGALTQTPQLTLTDFMGNTGSRWTTNRDWAVLYARFNDPPPQGGANGQSGDPIFISGSIGIDGTASFDSVFSFTGTGPTDPDFPAGDYSVELRDKDGQVLASRSFAPLDHLADLKAPLTQMPFTLILPFPAGVAKIVLLKGDHELASRVVPAQGPTVQMVSPGGGGTLSGEVTIHWTATEPGGTPLTYTVLYSADGGTTWAPLAIDLTDPSFVWNTSFLPGTQAGKFMVVANDGVNEASAVSDGTFTVASKPPVVGITAPTDGSAVAAGQPLLLQGVGYDLEDGLLPDSSLTWTSDRDGTLGSGSDLWMGSLSEGTHHITLTGTDRDGNQVQATITLVVSSQPGALQGTAFRDVKNTGALAPGDPTLAGWTVFLDLKDSGTLDPGDPTTQTNAAGQYSFANLPPGSHVVALVAPDGSVTLGNIAQVPPGGTAAAVDLAIAASSGAAAYFFLDGNHHLWAVNNGVPTDTGAQGTAISVGTDAQGAPEAFFLDGANRIYRYDQGAFTNTGGYALQLAAGQGELFFTDGNNQLWVYRDSGGFTQTIGFATRLSVGRDAAGRDELFLTDGANRIYRYGQGAFTATAGFALTLAAGRQGQLFFTDGNNQIWVYRDSGGFAQTIGFATRLQAGTDAAGQDELYVTDGNNRLYRFDQGAFSDTGSFAVDLTIAQAGELAFLDGNHRLWLFQDTGGLSQTSTFAVGFAR